MSMQKLISKKRSNIAACFHLPPQNQSVSSIAESFLFAFTENPFFPIDLRIFIGSHFDE